MRVKKREEIFNFEVVGHDSYITSREGVKEDVVGCFPC
jgi:hypothetical protein